MEWVIKVEYAIVPLHTLQPFFGKITAAVMTAAMTTTATPGTRPITTRGQQWVQVGSDYVLIAIATGLIASIVLSQ